MADIWTDGYQRGFIDGLEWALDHDPKLVELKLKEIEQEYYEQS